MSLAFRRWDRPRVVAGTRQRTRIGVVAIDAVAEVDPASISDADARAAGSASGDEVRALLDKRGKRGDPTWKIALHLDGPDPRIALRENAKLTDEDAAAIAARLERLDRASPRGPWTRVTLELIEANPETRAPDLAASQGLETQPFKRDVRKLKEIGLTESLPVGYRISPRGRAFMKRLRRAPKV